MIVKDNSGNGQTPRESYRLMQELEGWHRSLKAYDKAPLLARQVFGDVSTNPEEIGERFTKMYAQAKEATRQQELGCAYNFAFVSALLNQNRDDVAWQLISHLQEHDTPLYFISLTLGELDTSFLDQCKSHRTLITPTRLDDVVLNDYAPKSGKDARAYKERQGFALVFENPDKSQGGYAVGFTLDRSQGFSAVDQTTNRGISVVGIMEAMGHTFVDGREEQVRETIKAVFAKEGVKDYCVINADNPGIAMYLNFRFYVEKASKMIRAMTPIRSPPRHKIQRYRSDGKSESK